LYNHLIISILQKPNKTHSPIHLHPSISPVSATKNPHNSANSCQTIKNFSYQYITNYKRNKKIKYLNHLIQHLKLNLEGIVLLNMVPFLLIPISGNNLLLAKKSKIKLPIIIILLLPKFMISLLKKIKNKNYRPPFSTKLASILITESPQQ
jgi:hypothetical protein